MNTLSKTLALVLTLSTGIAAQGGQFGRTINFGTTAWGGNVGVVGHGNYSDINVAPFRRVQAADLGVASSSILRMNGQTREAYYVSADHDSTTVTNIDLVTNRSTVGSTIANAMRVRINGSTVFAYNSAVIETRAVNLSPLNLFGSSGIAQLVQVGPFFVTLSMNATSDVNPTITPRLSTATSTAGLHLLTSVQLEGSASASASSFGLTVGVNALLDLADPTVNLDVATDFRSATAVASWYLGVIRTHLEVFARFFAVEYRKTIINLDVPAFSGSLTANF